MPAKSDLNTIDLIKYLTATYATPEVNTNQVLAAADHFGVSYPTVCQRLEKFKSGRGKWNLTATELEETYNAPSAAPAVETSTLIPTKELQQTMIIDKRVDIKRNTNLLTELCKVDDLTDSLKDLVCHRTRPVK